MGRTTRPAVTRRRQGPDVGAVRIHQPITPACAACIPHDSTAVGVPGGDVVIHVPLDCWIVGHSPDFATCYRVPVHCSLARGRIDHVDVDGLDPVYAPGTGTPEIGGITTIEAQALLRGLNGLDLVGGDVVEVAPPFDQTGNTALVGATLMFEILCVLADARKRRAAQ